MRTTVTIVGAGPAGSSAALSALRAGASVVMYDKSQFPRHKVCGEFLSPEAIRLLEKFGVWSRFVAQEPAVLRRVFLSIGERTKSWKLDEPARGLSRFVFDDGLMRHAVENGAEFRREAATPRPSGVLAYGRHSSAPAGDRLFGFKAHFAGPPNDIMSLYFFSGAYVGVNSIEGGMTNVCGIAPERLLKTLGFEIDSLLHLNRPLKERTESLVRQMDWLMTGPLVFGCRASPADCYPAGDAAAFIDPFTGSGMLGALETGILAGQASAWRSNPIEFRRQITGLLERQQRASSILRGAIASGWAERLLPMIPGRVLFRATRPKSIS